MEKENKTFVQKYWIYIILFIIGLIIAAISIDVWFSNGNIQTRKITIFDSNNNPNIVDTYKFVYDYPGLKVLSMFLYSFSMSILVSLFILKVIQKDEKEQSKLEDKKRKNEIAQNVFKAVFNKLVPQEIFTILQDDIIKANIIRKNVRWVYDFKIEDNNIILKRNVTYEVHNLTNLEQEEPFSYTFSKTPYTSTEIKSLKWHDIEDKENTIVFYDTKESIDNNLEHDRRENSDKVYKKIKIPSKKARLINFISLEKHIGCTKFLRDTHFSNACSIGWELHVSYPEGYQFSIMSLFSGDAQVIIDDENKKQYKYSGGILKGQGIEFVLCKKEENNSIEVNV